LHAAQDHTDTELVPDNTLDSETYKHFAEFKESGVPHISGKVRAKLSASSGRR
jgi:hypothetical protein